MLLYRFDLNNSRSNVLKAHQIKLSDKKVRINPPEGWEEEEKQREEEISKVNQEAAEIWAKELEDINSLKDQIVAEAKKDAARITGSAQSESMKIVEAAIKEGQSKKNEITEEARKMGFDHGISEGRSQGDKLAAQATELLAEARREREEKIAGLENEMVEMVISVAEKILRDKVMFNPELILYMIRAGLSETTLSEDITLRVSQDDYDMVVENKDELLKSISGGAKLDIVKDMALGKADCVIETSYGYIDSSLGQQLDSIKENLRLIKSVSKNE